LFHLFKNREYRNIILRGRDIMVVGFTTTYAICAYHHRYEFESDPGKGVQHYLIKVVMISDLQQIGGFLRVFWLP
jgi:hypothetical protein